MDTFFEQIITRRPRGYEHVFRILLIAFCALLCVCLFLLSMSFAGTMLRPILLMAAVAMPFLGYYIVSSLHTEYEYSITNGYFDIDRITGKRKRVRMLSTSCDKFEVFGLYNPKKEQLAHQQFGAKILAANLDSENLYYAIVNHKEKGRTLIVIEPNERVLGAIGRFLPKLVARESGIWK